MRVLALSSSPRKDGNSRLLAETVLGGAASRGHDVELVDLDDVLTAPLRDCRTCRLADGRCGIGDGYGRLLHESVLPADALVLATPLYWYGVSGQLKIFLDRLFCYIKADYPGADGVQAGLMHKRLAAVLSAEESNLAAGFGVTAQLQELARYLRGDLVGVVRGIGNSRGEVRRDPARPLDDAHRLGVRLFDAQVTDYRMDSERSGVIWPIDC